MKRQLLATIIESHGRHSVRRIYMNAEGDKLRCTCSNKEVRNSDLHIVSLSCWHIEAVFKSPTHERAIKINFTELGRLEFGWRWAAQKLVEST